MISYPFYIYNILDFAADTGEGTFANYKPQKNKADKNIRRKVGCNGESSVKTVRDSAIDPLDFSDLVFNR